MSSANSAMSIICLSDTVDVLNPVSRFVSLSRCFLKFVVPPPGEGGGAQEIIGNKEGGYGDGRVGKKGRFKGALESFEQTK